MPILSEALAQLNFESMKSGYGATRFFPFDVETLHFDKLIL